MNNGINLNVNKTETTQAAKEFKYRENIIPYSCTYNYLGVDFNRYGIQVEQMLDLLRDKIIKQIKFLGRFNYMLNECEKILFFKAFMQPWVNIYVPIMLD